MTTRSNYKGNDLLVLKWKEDDKYPFSFGVGKARLILANLSAIEDFVREADKKKAYAERAASSDELSDDIPF